MPKPLHLGGFKPVVKIALKLWKLWKLQSFFEIFAGNTAEEIF